MASSVVENNCGDEHHTLSAGGETSANVAELGTGQALAAGHEGGIGTGQTALPGD